MTAAIAVGIFAVAYIVLVTDKVERWVVALVGAGFVVALRLLDSHDIFHSEDTGIHWEVIFLLLGMMLLVGVVRQSGVFEFLAIWGAKRAPRGRPYRIMVMLIVITAIASALLDNVTTVLLVAPVTVLVCERLGVRVAPFLIAEALASNIGGTATLIGDPPNIIIASQADLSYRDFLVHLAPLVVVLLVVYVAMVRVLFRSSFRYDPERAAGIMTLDEREAISDPRLLVKSMVVLLVVTIAFGVHHILHYDPSVVALLGAGALLALHRQGAAEAAKEIEWQTLVFFAGLFVMVGALVEAGVIDALADAVTDATGGSVLGATMLLVWASGFFSAIVDNIPYVATMAPVTGELVDGLRGSVTDPAVLWWALALGADLGGNATAIGASANVVVVSLARRSGEPISFLEFSKYGLVVAVVTTGIATLYLWLRYFVM